MGDFALVVFIQPARQIIATTYVKPLRDFFTLKNIDVMKFHCVGLPSRSSVIYLRSPTSPWLRRGSLRLRDYPQRRLEAAGIEPPLVNSRMFVFVRKYLQVSLFYMKSQKANYYLSRKVSRFLVMFCHEYFDGQRRVVAIEADGDPNDPLRSLHKPVCAYLARIGLTQDDFRARYSLTHAHYDMTERWVDYTPNHKARLAAAATLLAYTGRKPIERRENVTVNIDSLEDLQRRYQNSPALRALMERILQSPEKTAAGGQ